MFRKRTPEEMELLYRAEKRECSERYGAEYELLGLKIVGHKHGTLDVLGSFGVRQMKHGTEPSATWRTVTGEGAKEVLPCDATRWSNQGRCSNLRVLRLT
jgi:hypothetical protein